MTTESSEKNHPGPRTPPNRTARTVVVFLVLATGAFLLFGQRSIVADVRHGGASPESLLYAPGLFLFLAVVVAVDAIATAVRRGFLTGRSMLQLTFALVFTAFIGNGAIREYQARRVPAVNSAETLDKLSRSSDARVRALTMEVAARRGEPTAVLHQILRRGVDDADPLVWRTVLNMVLGVDDDIDDESAARQKAREHLDELIEADGLL